LKVTVLKDNKKKDYSFIYSLILLTLGIFLTFNSSGFLNIIFDIFGVIVLLFGIVRLSQYFRLKNQMHVEDTNALVSSILGIASGLLIILLSNFLTNAIQIVTGIWLFFMGINKFSNAMIWQNVNKKAFIVQVVGSVILVLLGLYTILTDNVVFIVIGIILIIYALFDLIDYFFRRV